MRTYQAFDYAEKTDIENLFLDCIEQCKKDQWRDENAKAGLRTASRSGPSRTNRQKSVHEGERQQKEQNK